MQLCMRALRRVVLTAVALVLAMFVAPDAHGQAGTVSGTVVDGKTGTPLADAQVLVEGSDTRTRTNIRGEFRINAAAGARLVVTRVGYQALTVTAGTGEMRIALTEFAVKLDEVVVTGTVGDSRTRTLGNAIGKVDVSANLERAPLVKIQDALSVNIPGVRVMRASGSVGSGGFTRIRGAGSLSLSNSPLLYVDGVRVNNSAAQASQAFRGAQEAPSRINDFNPEDIESIEVLKGPSAATIYGTEASNGVIQIRTKRGRAGRPTFDVHMDAGAAWLMDPDGRYPSNYYYSQTAQEVREFDVLKFNKEQGIDCSPQIEGAGCNPFSTGTPMAIGASLNGGSESVRYHLAADYGRDEGAVDYNWQNKLSARANIGYTSPKFTVDASLGYVRSKLRGASTTQPITTSILWACNFGSGSGIGGSCEPNPANPDNTGWNDAGHGYQFYRPEDYYGVEGYDNVDRATISLRLSHSPNSWFRHNLTVGPDYTNNKSTSLIERYPTARRPFFAASDGEKTARQMRATYLTVDYGASADWKPSQSLTFTTSAGAQYYYKAFDEFIAQGTVFSIPGPSDVTGSTNRTGIENFLENKSLGVYVQEQVNFKDRLFLTGAVRADDNSAFGSEFSSVFYPKFALSWVVKEETGSSSLLSQFRVRGAWGRAGQQPDVFSAIQTYNPVVGFQGTGGVTPQNIGNPNLKPEIGEEIEAGFDAGLWNGKVGIEFTYYDKKVKDAILAIPNKPSRGFPGNTFANIGATKNSGIEVALDVSPINSENTGLDFRFVYATNSAEITDMGGNPPAISPGGGSFIQQYYVEGYAPGGYWYKEVVSSDIQTLNIGIPLPVGFNPMCKGGTLIEGSTFLGVADGSVVPCAQAPQLFQGAATPTWSGSFSANLRLGKSFQLLGVLDYLGGNVIQVGDVSAIHHFFLSSKAILEGTDEILAGRLGTQLLAGDGGQTWGMSGLFKGGFMKLRTVAATYELPRGVLGWIGATRGSITMAGENLATLWREQKSSGGVDWVDPEVTPNRVADATGAGTYTQESWPQLARFRTTIRLTF